MDKNKFHKLLWASVVLLCLTEICIALFTPKRIDSK